MPSSKLSYSMKARLREIERLDARGASFCAGNTNSTMTALEQRGLVRAENSGGSLGWLQPYWRLTEAGRAALA